VTGFITRTITLGFCAFATLALAACGPDYSPNTYNGSAMQQANKVDTGIVIGFRQVKISDDGTVGAVTGGAAGGILGAETNSTTVPTALMALGGTVVGGVVGAGIQHATGDTTGWEYIVREPKGDLISVTQREPTPIAIGQKVLVIEGKQARIVPDYATAESDTPAPKAEDAKPAAAAPTATTTPPPVPGANPAPATDNAATTTPTPLAEDKDSGPGNDQSVPTSAPPAAQAAPPSPPAADASPPASAGSGPTSPAAPPS